MSATVREIVRDVVASAAPHEVPLVDALAPFDDERVTDLLVRRREGQDPLDLGITEVTALLTPVVWLAVSEVGIQGTGAGTQGATARLGFALRRLLRLPRPPRTVPPLGPDRLDSVHRHVLERATERGVGETSAQALADAVVSRLTRENASGPDPREPGCASG